MITLNERQERRLSGLANELAKYADNNTTIAHSTLASIARSYRLSYATGCIYAKKLGLTIR